MSSNFDRSSTNGSGLVQVRDVHKHFTRGNERIDVLKGISLQIPQGDFLALMGPSGSGKTTLLNLIGGLDAPTEGAVEVDGFNVSSLSGSRLSRWRSENIGFVFQLYNLLPKLTAERNVELPLLLTTLSKAERRARVAIALKVVGLADRAKHYPNQLSGGQEQRVGIARAIVTDPTLLLCDEPTGDLDRRAGDEILDLLQTLNRDHGKTIFRSGRNRCRRGARTTRPEATRNLDTQLARALTWPTRHVRRHQPTDASTAQQTPPSFTTTNASASYPC